MGFEGWVGVYQAEKMGRHGRKGGTNYLSGRFPSGVGGQAGPSHMCSSAAYHSGSWTSSRWDDIQMEA